ncbi:hypothetical protein [Methylobacterium oryzihabitans]|uniref:Uncharacterized protein n=1 Tax=Methylobacterium oryzihabitans TaxID=2499852 RepID=A0A3S2W377_9HYPH|nr:hypothetical protein [Methylobacterium oryzihabitans]RVU12500.1 hypothetical protein EOE48_27835 [Methylobacterium oryzihabitans]
MARVSIYVSDELKARMAEVGDALNWSDIARPAFETAISNFNHRKGQSMMTAIERLRASKQNYLQNSAQNGASSGREWAQNHASFYELKQVSNIDLDLRHLGLEDLAWTVHRAVDPDDSIRHDDFPNVIFGDSKWPSDEWLTGWVQGAQQFFEEVEDQL